MWFQRRERFLQQDKSTKMIDKVKCIRIQNFWSTKDVTRYNMKGSYNRERVLQPEGIRVSYRWKKVTGSNGWGRWPGSSLERRCVTGICWEGACLSSTWDTPFPGRRIPWSPQLSPPGGVAHVCHCWGGSRCWGTPWATLARGIREMYCNVWWILVKNNESSSTKCTNWASFTSVDISELVLCVLYKVKSPNHNVELNMNCRQVYDMLFIDNLKT